MYGSSALYTGQWEYGTTITGCAADNIGDAPNSITTLDGLNTYFLPFNKGKGEGIETGKGNPLNEDGFGVSYIWYIW